MPLIKTKQKKGPEMETTENIKYFEENFPNTRTTDLWRKVIHRERFITVQLFSLMMMMMILIIIP
jgi:hypothetical protein